AASRRSRLAGAGPSLDAARRASPRRDPSGAAERARPARRDRRSGPRVRRRASSLCRESRGAAGRGDRAARRGAAHRRFTGGRVQAPDRAHLGAGGGVVYPVAHPCRPARHLVERDVADAGGRRAGPPPCGDGRAGEQAAREDAVPDRLLHLPGVVRRRSRPADAGARPGTEVIAEAEFTEQRFLEQLRRRVAWQAEQAEQQRSRQRQEIDVLDADTLDRLIRARPDAARNAEWCAFLGELRYLADDAGRLPQSLERLVRVVLADLLER